MKVFHNPTDGFTRPKIIFSAVEYYSLRTIFCEKPVMTSDKWAPPKPRLIRFISENQILGSAHPYVELPVNRVISSGWSLKIARSCKLFEIIGESSGSGSGFSGKANEVMKRVVKKWHKDSFKPNNKGGISAIRYFKMKYLILPTFIV